MALRTVELLHPPDCFPSGGNVYNRSLVEAARLRGLPLSSRVVQASEIQARLEERSTHFRLWDSLFLESLAAHDLTRTKDWGVLLHYLPSENPALDRAERRRLANVEARALSAAALVIVTGRALESRVERAARHCPIFVCEPGVSEVFLALPQKQLERPSDTLELLTIANLLPGKGLVELLEIIAGIRHIDWRWHVIGDRSLDAEYTRRFVAAAKRLQLDGRIVHYDPFERAAIPDVMDRMDLFVFGSRFESYGMALAEAAARCLPAVTTDVGAAARLYRHGVTGLVASPEDTRSFSAYLARLMADFRLRQRFRENLRLCKARTWENTLDDFTTAIASLA
ncbi:MAG: glycosyltransferase family 4 protein [Burkholderiales bacterium]